MSSVDSTTRSFGPLSFSLSHSRTADTSGSGSPPPNSLGDSLSLSASLKTPDGGTKSATFNNAFGASNGFGGYGQTLADSAAGASNGRDSSATGGDASTTTGRGPGVAGSTSLTLASADPDGQTNTRSLSNANQLGTGVTADTNGYGSANEF